MNEGSTPNPWTIHRRFATVLLREALSGAGKLHVDYRVDTERETVRYYEPRRSANDPDPVPPPDTDLHKRITRSLLEGAGMRTVEVEVGGEPDFIDLYFVPSRRKPPAPGLLGQMTRKETILMVLHAPPVRRAAQAALAAVCPAEGQPVPIEDAAKDPILRACRKAYRRWAGR